jgi:catechol 2,3-dioxygenase-like lactoylglutathione lyase family enzyme
MANHGMHHLGLATHDMEATLEFYEQTLGFEARVCDLLQPEAGGTIRHAFLDVGQGEMIAFMECNEVPGIKADFDAGINKGLGIRGGVMHFAFKVQDAAGLVAKRDELREKGVEVTDVVDHGWCQSIYFRDPNDLQLEYCVVTEEFGHTHLADRESNEWRQLSRVQ